MSYLCFCKGTGSHIVHGWSGKDLDVFLCGMIGVALTTQRFTADWPSFSALTKSEKEFMLELTYFTVHIHTNMQNRYKHVLSIKEVQIEGKVILIELQSVTPSSQSPMLIRRDLSDIDSWINFLHEIMPAWAYLSPRIHDPLKCKIITLLSRG